MDSPANNNSPVAMDGVVTTTTSSITTTPTPASTTTSTTTTTTAATRANVNAQVFACLKHVDPDVWNYLSNLAETPLVVQQQPPDEEQRRMLYENVDAGSSLEQTSLSQLHSQKDMEIENSASPTKSTITTTPLSQTSTSPASPTIDVASTTSTSPASPPFSSLRFPCLFSFELEEQDHQYPEKRQYLLLYPKSGVMAYVIERGMMSNGDESEEASAHVQNPQDLVVRVDFYLHEEKPDKVHTHEGTTGFNEYGERNNNDNDYNNNKNSEEQQQHSHAPHQQINWSRYTGPLPYKLQRNFTLGQVRQCTNSRPPVACYNSADHWSYVSVEPDESNPHHHEHRVDEYCFWERFEQRGGFHTQIIYAPAEGVRPDQPESERHVVQSVSLVRARHLPTVILSNMVKRGIIYRNMFSDVDADKSDSEEDEDDDDEDEEEEEEDNDDDQEYADPHGNQIRYGLSWPYIDIHVLKREIQFEGKTQTLYTLVTNGMSDFPMRQVPPELLGRRDVPVRTELCMYVGEVKERYISILQWMARYVVHTAQTWICPGHTLYSPVPIHPGSQLQHFLLLDPIIQSDRALPETLYVRSADDEVSITRQEQLRQRRMENATNGSCTGAGAGAGVVSKDDDDIPPDEGDPIHLMWVVPITDAEREYKLKHGYTELLNLFNKFKHPFILDESRKSYV